jgi:NACalpha-BTF3-like transcription factor
MGEKKPGFSPGLKTSTILKVDDKPVETLTEVECEIYLKKALKEENYELADAIRKRAEKFR